MSLGLRVKLCEVVFVPSLSAGLVVVVAAARTNSSAGGPKLQRNSFTADASKKCTIKNNNSS